MSQLMLLAPTPQTMLLAPTPQTMLLASMPHTMLLAPTPHTMLLASIPQTMLVASIPQTMESRFDDPHMIESPSDATPRSFMLAGLAEFRSRAAILDDETTAENSRL